MVASKMEEQNDGRHQLSTMIGMGYEVTDRFRFTSQLKERIKDDR